MRRSTQGRRLLGIGLVVVLPVVAVGIHGKVAPIPQGSPPPVAVPDPPRAGSRTATFSMYCYRTGEAVLDTVPGVLWTRIGRVGRTEIVQVTYDPATTDLGKLARALKGRDSFYACLVPREEAVREARAFLSPGEVRLSRREPRFAEGTEPRRAAPPPPAAVDVHE